MSFFLWKIGSKGWPYEEVRRFEKLGMTLVYECLGTIIFKIL